MLALDRSNRSAVDRAFSFFVVLFFFPPSTAACVRVGRAGWKSQEEGSPNAGKPKSGYRMKGEGYRKNIWVAPGFHGRKMPTFQSCFLTKGWAKLQASKRPSFLPSFCGFVFRIPGGWYLKLAFRVPKL